MQPQEQSKRTDESDLDDYVNTELVLVNDREESTYPVSDTSRLLTDGQLGHVLLWFCLSCRP